MEISRFVINCEIEPNLKWTKNFEITEVSRTFRAVDPNADPAVYELVIPTTGATFQINNANFYVPVVTLSINDNIKFLENIRQGFKRKISWNKYTSEITTQPKNNNLDYLIDPTFRNINRLVALSFKNGDNDNDTARNAFEKYYIPLIEIKDFDALIDNKPFFDQPVKTNKKRMKNLLKC